MAGPCANDTESITLTVTDNDELEADIRKSPDAYNGVDVRANGLWVPGRPQIVTALPSGVDDLTEIIYKISDSVLWRLTWSDEINRWIAAAGSMSLYARRDNNEQRSSATLGTLNGPSVQLPGDISGDFLLRFGGRVANSTTALGAGTGAYIAPKFSAAAADEAFGVINIEDNLISVSTEVQLIGVPAGQLIDLRYRSGNTDPANFSARWMSLIPLLINGV